MRTRHVVLGIGLLLATACVPATGSQTQAATAALASATLPATPAPPGLAPAAAETIASLAPSLTPTPIIGTTTTQVNVRPEPVSIYPPVGVLNASASVSILGRAPGSNWYKIAYEAAPGGAGWVAAQYVSAPNAGLIPVAGSNDGRPLGSVREPINVRSGPGTEFQAVGIINAGDAIPLAGKDPTGVWLQIDFVSGPEGRGWVAASFLEEAVTDGLPIVDERGQVLGTSTATGAPPIPTPTMGTARDDGDSQEAPGAEMIFAPTGTGSLLYSSEISTPDGDTADWIRFTTYEAQVRISLTCSGSGELRAILTPAGLSGQELHSLKCGETIGVRLERRTTYVLQVMTAVESPERTFVRYTASIYGTPMR